MNFSMLKNKCIIIKNLGHPKCKSAWANCSYLSKEAAFICCQQDPFSGDCCHWQRTDTSSFLRTQNKSVNHQIGENAVSCMSCMNHALCQNFTPAAAAKAAFLWRNTHWLCLKIILVCTIEQDKPARSGVSGPASLCMVNGNNSAELPNHCIEYIPLFLAPLWWWWWCLRMLAASVLSLSLLSALDSAVDFSSSSSSSLAADITHNFTFVSSWNPERLKAGKTLQFGATSMSYPLGTCGWSSRSSGWACVEI